MARWCTVILFCLTVSCAGYADADSSTLPEDVKINFSILGQRIASGQANLAEVRLALTDRDIGRLTNTVHALYSMRWHRGVINALRHMWSLSRENYPEISWDLISNPPVRIALASTLSRIQMADTGEYLDYMRAHQNHQHEFVRAQVVVGLGLNGYKEDIPYIQSMADSDNDYVVQSAITSLALMQSNPARDALIELWLKHRDSPRQKLIEEILRQAYNLEPKVVPLESKKSEGE